MRIIAIDPGPTKSAFVAWDTGGDRFVPVPEKKHIGLWDNTILKRNIYWLLDQVRPDIIAIEMIQSYGFALGRDSLKTILFIGRLSEKFELEAKALYDIAVPLPKIKYYGRPTIKAQIGGRKDPEIRQSLRLRYGEAKKGEKLEGVKKDIWAALALAAALTERPNMKEW